MFYVHVLLLSSLGQVFVHFLLLAASREIFMNTVLLNLFLLSRMQMTFQIFVYIFVLIFLTSTFVFVQMINLYALMINYRKRLKLVSVVYIIIIFTDSIFFLQWKKSTVITHTVIFLVSFSPNLKCQTQCVGG